ncbi:MAG: peptidylprolyl isomerase, partial [Enterococcus hulanensis]
MKFRKGWLCFGALIMLGSVFFGLASSTEAKSKVHDYSKEKTVEQLIGRHWDETEIKEQYEKFSKKLTDEKSIKGEIVSDISKADKKKITDYFDKFAGKKVEYVYTKFDQFYKVKADDDYNDLRAILEYKFKVTEKKKVTEYSVLLKMARLGDKDGVKWQIYDILWQDTGVDVSDIELTQLEAPSKGEEVCVMDTDAGVIKMRLFPDQAPKAVKNWIELSKDGFYDG